MNRSYTKCPTCGADLSPDWYECRRCGAQLPDDERPQPGPHIIFDKAAEPAAQKSRLTAGLLGVFLGLYGVHSFYLGDTKKGVMQIILTLCTCHVAGLWGFIEGIMILSGGINTDAEGRPLKS